MFGYYGPDVSVTAIEPDDEFRGAAEHAAYASNGKIRVTPGVAESLSFLDDSVDAIVSYVVLRSVDSIPETLAEFKRVLTNPLWLRINKVGCNWNRRVEGPVREAGFRIASMERHKVYSPSAPTAWPYLLIKAAK